MCGALGRGVGILGGGGVLQQQAGAAPGRAGLRPSKGRGTEPLTKIRMKPTQTRGNRVTEKLK